MAYAAHAGYHGNSTRLGGHAFNHNQSSSSEAEYDRLRDLARQEAGKRSSCFDKAHQAYERGDGGAAHELSEEGKRHGEMMEQYNRQASEYIFRENNAQDRVGGDTIDLHGQYVEEAERILEERIRAAQSQGQTHLHVIVGKGNHSRDHVQKIKPRVEQVCRELGLQYNTEANEGRMYINLQGGSAANMPPMPMPPGGGGGYGGGGYGVGGGYPAQQQQQYGGGGGGGGGYGQPHYGQGGGQHHGGGGGGGHHQQNNQLEQEVEKAARKFLPRLLRSCCSVM